MLRRHDSKRSGRSRAGPLVRGRDGRLPGPGPVPQGRSGIRMTKDIGLDPRSERMLELLSKGGWSRELAEKLGYQEGTMRVYLHHLYKKIGVANKTEAVIWWLKRANGHAAPAVEARLVEVPITDDLFGDMALREGLLAALGVM